MDLNINQVAVFRSSDTFILTKRQQRLVTALVVYGSKLPLGKGDFSRLS
jgi:hypothetical protein